MGALRQFGTYSISIVGRGTADGVSFSVDSGLKNSGPAVRSNGWIISQKRKAPRKTLFRFSEPWRTSVFPLFAILCRAGCGIANFHVWPHMHEKNATGKRLFLNCKSFGDGLPIITWIISEFIFASSVFVSRERLRGCNRIIYTRFVLSSRFYFSMRTNRPVGFFVLAQYGN